jgi:hypothetical protein
MRAEILKEIKRLADANCGLPPGERTFSKETGILRSAWRGVYWARWGDAVADAGFQPNSPALKIEEAVFLAKIADACRHFGRLPTTSEFRLYRRTNAEFPDQNAIYRHFQTTDNMFRRLAEWTVEHTGYADVAAMLVDRVAMPAKSGSRTADGFVYLIRWGNHYKIGRGEQLERRVKQVRTGLPDSGTLTHAIRTDDPPGIEAYWHRRFADRRANNGEWFKLTASDVAAFKRRKFQ